MYNPLLPDEIADTVYSEFDWPASEPLERVLDMQEYLVRSRSDPAENHYALYEMVATQNTDTWIHVLNTAMVDKADLIGSRYSVDYVINNDFAQILVIAEADECLPGKYEKPNITFHTFERLRKNGAIRYSETVVNADYEYHESSLEMLLVIEAIQELIEYSVEEQKAINEALDIYIEDIKGNLG